MIDRHQVGPTQGTRETHHKQGSIAETAEVVATARDE